VEKLQDSNTKLQGSAEKIQALDEVTGDRCRVARTENAAIRPMSAPRHPSPVNRHGCRAFTLIELMVVLVLIGIMTAVLIPEMRGSYEDALLRSTSREIINVCHLTYSRAVSLNQVHRLQLDEHTGKYFVEKRVRETDQGGDFVRVQDVSGLEGELDKRITIQIREPGEEPSPSPSPDGSAPLPAEPGPQLLDSNAGILFNPDGTADAREIRLRDRDGFRLGLRINPVTARIHIVELPRE
jgi:type II secretion system protein H